MLPWLVWCPTASAQGGFAMLLMLMLGGRLVVSCAAWPARLGGHRAALCTVLYRRELTAETRACV